MPGWHELFDSFFSAVDELYKYEAIFLLEITLRSLSQLLEFPIEGS